MDDLLIKIRRLEREVDELKAKLKSYEAPGDMRAYYAMQRILNQQADFLSKFDLEYELKRFERDDKVYDRASDLWEKLPTSISKLALLKTEIGITGNEEKDTAIKASFLDRAAQ
jgi:hypothetical protein